MLNKLSYDKSKIIDDFLNALKGFHLQIIRILFIKKKELIRNIITLKTWSELL